MPCIHPLDAAHARILRQARVQLAVAHVHARDVRRAVLEQAVGKAARGLAHIQAAQAAHIQRAGRQRARARRHAAISWR